MKYIIVTLSAAILCFAGCKKVEDINNNGMPPLKTGTPYGTEASVSMRTFASADSLYAEMERTLGFTYAELDAYEQSIGFNSFGKIADQRMEAVLNMVERASIANTNAGASAAALAKIMQAISDNSQYLHIVIDENNEESCETKYFQSPYRYLMNADGMFQVDTTCVKVFAEGHASCGISHYNDLLNLSEAQFDLLEETDTTFNVFKYDDGNRGNYGMEKEVSTSNGNSNGSQKVYVKIYYVPGIERANGQGLIITYSCWRARTRALHKWCGIWWKSNRTYSQDITAQLVVHNTLYNGYCSGTRSGYYIDQVLVLFSGTYPIVPVRYIKNASGWGKVPAVTCYINWQ